MSKAARKKIPWENRAEERAPFFAKGQACLRPSPLAKRYGWGVHCDAKGKVALYGVDSDEYGRFVEDDSITKKKAMRARSA